MEEALGRSLATGNTAEVFERGSRVMKLLEITRGISAAFQEAAASAAVKALGFPVPRYGTCVILRVGLVFDRGLKRRLPSICSAK